MQSENLSILRRFIMEYGTILGLCWVAVFLLYVVGFRTQDGIFMMLGLVGLIGLVAVEFCLGCRLKRRSLQLGIRLTPLFSFMNIVSIFMYACLLCGCVEYIYFAYIDKGTLFDSILAMLNAPELRNTYGEMGMTEYYKQAIDTVNELGTLSAFEKTLILFNQNFFASLVLSIPVAIVYYFYRPSVLK